LGPAGILAFPAFLGMQVGFLGPVHTIIVTFIKVTIFNLPSVFKKFERHI
jgi:hypothetical protein